MTNRRVVLLLVCCLIASEATKSVAHRFYKPNWITSELILDESNVVMLLANKVYEFVFIAGQWVLTGAPLL